MFKPVDWIHFAVRAFSVYHYQVDTYRDPERYLYICVCEKSCSFVSVYPVQPSIGYERSLCNECSEIGVASPVSSPGVWWDYRVRELFCTGLAWNVTYLGAFNTALRLQNVDKQPKK